LTVVAVVAIAVVGAYGWTLYQKRSNTITLTAQFDNTAGLYVTNRVAVLGMQVGSVSKITPKTGYVEVEFTVDKDVPIPADAQAVTLQTSILADRQIELTPPYKGGPKLKNHDTIGLSRTKTPVEFARTLDMIDRLSTSLGGDGKGNGPTRTLSTRGRRSPPVMASGSSRRSASCRMRCGSAPTAVLRRASSSPPSSGI
jgi:virulence factor Mce-like protein